MSLYLWMGEWKSQTSECRERIASGKKSPHLFPSPFTLLGTCMRLGYCHYPGNCLLAAIRTQAGVHRCSEAHQRTQAHSVYWTTLCFSSQDLRAHLLLSLREYKHLARSKQEERQCSFGGIWCPSTDSPSSCRDFFVVDVKDLIVWEEGDEYSAWHVPHGESALHKAKLTGLPKSKLEGTGFPWRQTASGAARDLHGSHFTL